ncbi:MAG: hypothetical protein ACREBF_04290 [Candidatus Micrarchaeales archaeon]
MQTKRFAGKRKTPKYGSLSKAFSDVQLSRFLHAVDSDKFRLLFSYQAQLGLRIGEAVRVNIGRIDFETRELTLKTEKAQVMDSLLIPVPLFKETIAFISKHKSEIEQAQELRLLSNKRRPILGGGKIGSTFDSGGRLQSVGTLALVNRRFSRWRGLKDHRFP